MIMLKKTAQRVKCGKETLLVETRPKEATTTKQMTQDCTFTINIPARFVTGERIVLNRALPLRNENVR